MPLSIWLGMEDCLQLIVESRPKAILDVGIGFGLWGHLLRQYLDVWSGRIQRQQWITRLDGIEIEESRVQTHSRYLYSHVHIGDMREILPKCVKECPYDVILFGDVLEHLPKGDALSLLRHATQHARRLVVVRIPLGDGWRKAGREPPDHHRSEWTLDDFAGYPGSIYQYDFYGNPYVVVAIEIGATRPPSALCEIEQRLQEFEARLDHLVRN